MINAGLKISAFDGTQSFNATTKNWDNVSIQVNYPSLQSVTVNPVSVNDVVIEPNGNVWKVTVVSLVDSATRKFKVSLLLTSSVPSVDISPSFGTVSRGAIVTPKNGLVSPYWDSVLVATEVDRISTIYNNEVVGIPGLVDGKLPLSQLPVHSHTVTKADVGLGNVDNTADSAKAVLSATRLATARSIGGVTFDGTTNINLPGVNAVGNQNTTGNAATATKLATARNIGGVTFDGTADISLPGVNAVGNQNTTGNAATATKLATARSINGVLFDGAANITINAVDSTVRIAATEKGVANGVATLDATGKVPSTQLPPIAETLSLVEIEVISWASSNWVLPSGITAAKEYNDSSIRITHNKGKFPKSWLVLNKENDPYVGLVQTSTTNIQCATNGNSLIITNVGALDKFSISLTF